MKDTAPTKNLNGSLASNKLHRAIAAWLPCLDELPGWREFKRKSMASTMFHDDIIPAEPVGSDYKFPPDIELQHSAIMSYYALMACARALGDVEYYFRRFPFHGLPVTHHDHLRYICEMYFSRFYEFESRLKVCLNAIDAATTGERLAIGRVIKEFKKEFDQELRARNSIHHHMQFEDMAIDRLMLTGNLTDDPVRGEMWTRQHKEYYRKATKEWAARASRMGARLDTYVEGVAEVMLHACMFLTAESRK